MPIQNMGLQVIIENTAYTKRPPSQFGKSRCQPACVMPCRNHSWTVCFYSWHLYLHPRSHLRQGLEDRADYAVVDGPEGEGRPRLCRPRHCPVGLILPGDGRIRSLCLTIFFRTYYSQRTHVQLRRTTKGKCLDLEQGELPRLSPAVARVVARALPVAGQLARPLLIIRPQGAAVAQVALKLDRQKVSLSKQESHAGKSHCQNMWFFIP